ncbi:MAG TPA: hypothetical protein VJN18_10925, partial [Polyangiaceae bacterium]|nr:hypothetical protein [Polyangiaceae bacterium]
MSELPRWASGKRYVYTSTLQSKLVLSGQTMMGFDLAAKLALETREVSGETEFVAQLSEAKFKADSAANQAQFDALARELVRPFGFSQKQGKLSSLQLPEGWSPFATSISRTLAAGLQLAARSADQKESGWTATEVDATGQYDVEYSPQRGAPNILSKRKLRYASVNLGKITIGQFGAKVAPEVLESVGSVTLGRGPDASPLSSVDYREKLKVQLTPASLVDSETTLKLAHQVPPAAASFDWATALTGTKKLAPDDVPTTP